VNLDELEHYFDQPQTVPVKNEATENIANYVKTLDELTDADVSQGVIAIIGVTENRNATTWAKFEGVADDVRRHFFSLKRGNFKPVILDLGNLKNGESATDTYAAIAEIVATLIRHAITPFFIGGSQDLTYAQYLAYQKLEQTVNIVGVDPTFDLGTVDDEITSETYLGKIITHQPNHLFNFSNIGFQTYFVEQTQIELMQKMFFDVHRLGDVRARPEECEPVMRNADIVSFDMSSIRSADARAISKPTPNGFYAEEACKIMRYAGLSEKLSCVGIFELTDEEDGGQTTHLGAQMMWFFLEGYYSRKVEMPTANSSNYTLYNVPVQNSEQPIVFYKSNMTNKWWMDVPYSVSKKNRYERHHFVPCSYNDYLTSVNDEVPDRWWQAYQKLL
jgi:arginase family enzyme